MFVETRELIPAKLRRSDTFHNQITSIQKKSITFKVKKK